MIGCEKVFKDEMMVFLEFEELCLNVSYEFRRKRVNLSVFCTSSINPLRPSSPSHFQIKIFPLHSNAKLRY